MNNRLESKIMFVANLDPDDRLTDISAAINEMARDYGCRAVIFIGTINSGGGDGGDDGDPGPQEIVPPPTQAMVPPSTNGHHAQPPQPKVHVPAGIRRRQIGTSVFLANQYPDQNDLSAVRNEVAKLGADPIDVLVINPHYGEYALAAIDGCNAATVYCAHEDEFPAEPEFNVFDMNTKERSSQIKLIRKSIIAEESFSNSNVSVLILVDPKPEDFARFSRHLKYGGLLILASTNGASPDKPEIISSRLADLTAAVSCMYRRSAVPAE